MDIIKLTDRINEILDDTPPGPVTDTLIMVRDKLIPECASRYINQLQLEIAVIEGEMLLAESAITNSTNYDT